MELIILLAIVGVVLAPGWFVFGAIVALIHELLKPKEDRFK